MVIFAFKKKQVGFSFIKKQIITGRKILLSRNTTLLRGTLCHIYGVGKN